MYGGDDPSNESDPSGEDPIPGGIELPSGCQGTTAGSLSPDEYTDCTIDSLSFQVLVPFADSASQIGVPNAIQVDWGISWQSSPYDETGELGQAASFAQDFDGSTTSQAEGRALLKACDNGDIPVPSEVYFECNVIGIIAATSNSEGIEDPSIVGALRFPPDDSIAWMAAGSYSSVFKDAGSVASAVELAIGSLVPDDVLGLVEDGVTGSLDDYLEAHGALNLKTALDIASDAQTITDWYQKLEPFAPHGTASFTSGSPCGGGDVV